MVQLWGKESLTLWTSEDGCTAPLPAVIPGGMKSPMKTLARSVFLCAVCKCVYLLQMRLLGRPSVCLEVCVSTCLLACAFTSGMCMCARASVCKCACDHARRCMYLCACCVCASARMLWGEGTFQPSKGLGKRVPTSWLPFLGAKIEGSSGWP